MLKLVLNKNFSGIPNKIIRKMVLLHLGTATKNISWCPNTTIIFFCISYTSSTHFDHYKSNKNSEIFWKVQMSHFQKDEHTKISYGNDKNNVVSLQGQRLMKSYTCKVI